MMLSIVTNFFLNKFLVILIDFFAVFLAFLVFKDNPKGKINRIYLIMTLLMICWVTFAYVPRIISEGNYNLAISLLKIAWFVTPIFFAFLYFLFICLIEKEEKYKKLTKSVFVCGGILALLAGFSNAVVAGFTLIEFGLIRIIYGDLILPFLAGVCFLIWATLYPLSKEKEILKDKKVRYFLIGLLIFYGLNIVFNILLPIFFDISRFYFLGDYSTLILLGFIAYTITKYRLFGIKVILTQLLVGVIGSILFIVPFFINIFWLKVLLFITFFLFCIFGYLLIESVLREVRQKEILEEKVKERTKELEKTKNIAEEKTRELEKRKEELERVLKAVVGRELRMIELKQKIKELEEKLKK